MFEEHSWGRSLVWQVTDLWVDGRVTVETFYRKSEAIEFSECGKKFSIRQSTVEYIGDGIVERPITWMKEVS